MDQAQPGDNVKVEFSGISDDGRSFSGDLEFTIGAGKVIPGFEEVVIGMVPGESRTERVPSNRAFGPYREDLVLDIEKKYLPDGLQFETGEHFEIPREDGRTTEFVVKEVSDAVVTFDANHPLAGTDIVFDVTLVSVK